MKAVPDNEADNEADNKAGHPARPYLLLVLATAIWAGNFVIGRAMHGDIPPLTLNFFRWSAAFVLLAPFAIRTVLAEREVLKRHWKWLVLLTGSGVVLFHTFVYTALQTTTAINAGLMIAATPIIIPGVAWAIHRDRPSARQMAGIAASVAGVMVIISRADLGVLASLTFQPGDLWMLAAVPMWAFYSVILKDRPAGLSASTLVLSIAGLGALMAAPLFLWERSAGLVMEINAANVLTIGYVAVFASIVAYFAWNRGVADIGAIRAGPFLHLLPVFSGLLAMLFLGEMIEPFHIPGIALIVTGIWLTTRKGH